MKLTDLLKDAYKDGMTVEEIETALESINLPEDGSAEIERLKNALSKSNSEANDYKKQLRDKMSEDERKAKEDAEKQEELQKNYDALLRKVTISENKSKFLALGYDDKLADETAEAMANGDLEKVFTNQKKHLEAMEKKVRAEVLKDTPKPDGGNSGNEITKEQFDKMGYSERLRVHNENPDLYKQYTGGNE